MSQNFSTTTKTSQKLPGAREEMDTAAVKSYLKHGGFKKFIHKRLVSKTGRPKPFLNSGILVGEAQKDARINRGHVCITANPIFKK